MQEVLEEVGSGSLTEAEGSWAPSPGSILGWAGLHWGRKPGGIVATAWLVGNTQTSTAPSECPSLSDPLQAGAQGREEERGEKM